MTLPIPRILPFAVPLLLHGIPPAQTADDHRRITPATATFAALQSENGTLTAAGRDYRATFDHAGTHFVPALGERAASEHPVTLRPTAYGRGTADKPLPAVAPIWQDHTVTFRRDAIAETLEVRPEGLKQSFVFTQRPVGEGDLIVTVGIDTDLVAEPAGDDAMRFHNELGGVHIGGVLGLDAAGRQVRGTMQWQGGALQLRLPATFVDDAVLPLVLDPLIGSSFTVVTGARDLDPDVAYDATSNKFLVVWWRRYSAITADIYGQFVHNTVTGGAELSGSSVILRVGANAQRARVGNCSARDAFVVVWQEVINMVPLPTHRDVMCRALNATTLGTTATVFNAPTDDFGIEVAGDTTNTNASVVVSFLNGGNAVLRRVNVSTSLACTQGANTVVTTGGNTSQCRLTKNGGAADRYLVATLNTSGTASLRAYSGTGTMTQLGSTLTLSSSTAVVDFAIDGNGSRWAVAWAARESGSSTNHDIRVGTWAWNPTTNALQQDIFGLTFGQTGVNEVEPSVAVVDHTFALAYVVANTTREVRLRTYGLFNCSTCESEITVTTGTSTLAPVIASQRSVGEIGLYRDDALLVWQADTGTTSPISAGRWTAEAGIATTVAPACGGLTASAIDQCAVQGAPAHIAVLTNAPAGASCFFVLSPTRRDATGCGSCVLVPDLWNAVIEGSMTPDAFGNAQVLVPIPASTFLIGLRFYEQWLVADATSPGCPQFAFDFSNALQVQIQ
ncbi:MAG: hypothetical protein IPK26_28240 [Planctomycetes bacterium]|nr:hypothetical protein [Planctomycetota bacterium]